MLFLATRAGKKTPKRNQECLLEKKSFWWVLLFSVSTIHLRALRRNLQNSFSMNDVKFVKHN